QPSVLRGELSVFSIWCIYTKADISVITPSPLAPSPLQLPFYLFLFLQSRACSSVGIIVCSSSEEG
ncbi:hypothetical protein KUCAC02_001579, partial [Chaenocephalus aceratus]